MDPILPAVDDEVMRQVRDAHRRGGIWEKVCDRCGAVVGGRLAEYGEPTDLRHCACPECHGHAGDGCTFSARYVPPKEQ